MSRRLSKWRDEVRRSSRLTGQQKVLLLLLAENMDGRLYATVERDRLAEQLGVTPQQVKKLTQRCREHGFLDLVSSGNRGGPSTYVGVFGP